MIPEIDLKQARTSEPVFNIPGIILVLIALCVVAFLAQDYILDDQQNLWVMMNLAYWPVRFSQGGGFGDPAAWLTAVTYSFLHGGFAHIAVNMVWLAAFGSPLAGRIGTTRMIIFWIVTAIAAAFTHYAIHPDSAMPLVGASGSISGMMGAAARYGFRRVPDILHDGKGRSEFAGPLLPIGVTLTLRPVLAFLGVWFVVNLATGLVSMSPMESASIAWEAHIGGFLVGFFGIALLDRPSPLDAAIRRY
ncbi:rhomboid family intramembrane serine protease [Phyllobacterium salinisoli]|uniref:Rhomboid family intramembrane serine protease n=1 Tax=Phyllobacterium salinisoli TaxID=1899321 RepID=A0A368JXX7_9HYPH|nr:rhomboid family intramembrane serine protease [Phyllobacterium salinisoli]RCS22008.1 rhomboid family intramembrane serine protease [Phyllobacterium salinisoli]